MASAKDNLIQDYRNWVSIFIDYDGRQLCLDVLFKKKNWPTDEVHFYKRLEPERSRIYLFNNEHQILCPSSGFTDHCDFDLNLFTRVIELICGSKYQSLGKNLRNLRNQECHRGNIELPDTDFNTILKCTVAILQKHGFELSLVEGLKDGDSFSDQ